MTTLYGVDVWDHVYEVATGRRLSFVEVGALLERSQTMTDADRIAQLKGEVEAYRAAVENHRGCNAYDCGNCVGAIIAEVAEALAQRSSEPAEAKKEMLPAHGFGGRAVPGGDT